MVGFVAFGQKETLKTFDAEDIESIRLKTDEVFRIRISTAPAETITIRTRADGEYYNNISLDSEIKGETLELSSRFREILQSGYDKLSAHKVFAMEVELKIPENLNVEIISNLASVEGEGDYQNLLIQLKSGSCHLENFSGNASINTYRGDVTVETAGGMVEASSRNGTTNIPSHNFGQHLIHITSINGDIWVKKTK